MTAPSSGHINHDSCHFLFPSVSRTTRCTNTKDGPDDLTSLSSGLHRSDWSFCRQPPDEWLKLVLENLHILDPLRSLLLNLSPGSDGGGRTDNWDKVKAFLTLCLVSTSLVPVSASFCPVRLLLGAMRLNPDSVPTVLFTLNSWSDSARYKTNRKQLSLQTTRAVMCSGRGLMVQLFLPLLTELEFQTESLRDWRFRTEWKHEKQKNNSTLMYEILTANQNLF